MPITLYMPKTIKPTKNPKSVTVIDKTIKSYTSEYTCPLCRATYRCRIDKNVTRFLCDCGQELIIKQRKEIDNG